MKNFVVSAPGKVILFGEHAVVYGKAAIAVSLNLRTTIRVSSYHEPVMKVNIRNPDMNLSWDLNDISALGLSGDAKNPKELDERGSEVLRKFVSTSKTDSKSSDGQTEFTILFLYASIVGDKGKDCGIRVDLNTELPVGAGLGSSASFSVSVSAAFLNYAGALNTHNNLPLEEEDLDLINRWAFMAEKIFHGRPSGIDNSVCTFGGGVIHRSGNYNSVQMPSDLRILVVNSKVPRKTKEIVAYVRENFQKYPNILNPVFNAIDNISNHCIETLKGMAKSGSTKETCSTLEDLIGLNHGLLRTLGVSHEKLEDIVSTAARFSLRAKLTGAGAGGFAYVLLSPDKSNSTQNLKEQLEQQGFQCWEVGIGGKGITLQYEE